jgi:hypothetical protein
LAVAVLQGTLVILPLLPYGLAEHIYGSDALLYKPQRWLPTAAAAPIHDETQFAAPAGPEVEGSSTDSAVGTFKQSEGGGSVPSAERVGGDKGVSAAVPADPLTFMTGQRDW